MYTFVYYILTKMILRFISVNEVTHVKKQVIISLSSATFDQVYDDFVHICMYYILVCTSIHCSARLDCEET